MLENENVSGQTNDAEVSVTNENPDGSQNTAEVNDSQFSENSSENADGDKGQPVKEEKSEEKPKQSRETNAENARRRRETEKNREMTALRNKTILDVLGGKNPFTGEDMKDDTDVEEYLEMKEMQSKGLDPVSDYPRYKKQKERERKEAEDAAAAQKEWYAADTLAFEAAYPDVKLEEIVKSEAFQKYAAGKVGKVPLAEIYGDFLHAKEVFIEEYKKQTAQEYANKKASPGALGGNVGGEKKFFTRDEVSSMSRSEIRKHFAAIEESMKKW